MTGVRFWGCLFVLNTVMVSLYIIMEPQGVTLRTWHTMTGFGMGMALWTFAETARHVWEAWRPAPKDGWS